MIAIIYPYDAEIIFYSWKHSYPPPKYWIWKSLFSCSFGEKVLKYFFWQNWWLLKTPEFEKANYAHFFICRFDEKLLKTSSDNSWKLHCMKILKIQKWYHNCVLWTNIADGIFWGIWTSCRLVSICGKRIKSSCYRMCYFKVVIPSTSYGKKNVFFDPSWWSFHFWTWYLGKGTWDRYSQAPKMHLVISNTCSQHAFTTVIQKAKIHLLKQFWTQK